MIQFAKRSHEADEWSLQCSAIRNQWKEISIASKYIDVGGKLGMRSRIWNTQARMTVHEYSSND